MSRRPTATILKLIRGDPHTERLKDDKPKIAGAPVIPPGVQLTADEQRFFEWLIAHVVVPGVHGTSDGAVFVQIAKTWARLCEVDRKLEQHGLVMKNPESGKPELNPYTRLSRDLGRELRVSLAEIGATPSGRVPLAGPRGSRAAGEPTSWDEID